MNKNIILIGMMGAGKSSVARVLQNTMDDDFDLIDSDTIIEKKIGLSIPQIFADKGEFFF